MVMDTIAVGMSIGALGGHMYSIFLFLCGDWMVECVVAVTIYLLLTVMLIIQEELGMLIHPVGRSDRNDGQYHSCVSTTAYTP
ncbi:hypothetical protein SDJN03_29701, partial [Cucurbita argyrosperma subsp. sororia]